MLWRGLETQKKQGQQLWKKWQRAPQIHHILVSYVLSVVLGLGSRDQPTLDN